MEAMRGVEVQHAMSAIRKVMRGGARRERGPPVWFNEVMSAPLTTARHGTTPSMRGRRSARGGNPLRAARQSGAASLDRTGKARVKVTWVRKKGSYSSKY
ncbi:hypothetical protein J6590_002197 [Homalodisca vitripennis]|nr:hypothetical protein J6590_002197 [Homalodisca vitripennis]